MLLPLVADVDAGIQTAGYGYGRRYPKVALGKGPCDSSTFGRIIAVLAKKPMPALDELDKKYEELTGGDDFHRMRPRLNPAPRAILEARTSIFITLI